MLLGAWTSADGLAADSLIIDAGAGCGLIGLMMAQRCHARIIGVEIDEGGCRDCTVNFAASPWADRLTCVYNDFLTFIPSKSVDLIVSNPPFFTTGERAPAKSRATARHEDNMPLSALIKHAAEILGPQGRLAMIAPVDRSEDIIFHGALSGLPVYRLCHVATTEGKPPRRILVELGKTATPYTECQLTLRHSDGTPTEEYSKLVNQFYIKI